MSKYLRTTMRHEDDGYPILIWFVSSFAVGLLSAHGVAFMLRTWGYTAIRQVRLVGGGSVSIIPMTTAEYYGGMVGPLVMCVGVCVWMLRDSMTEADE